MLYVVQDKSHSSHVAECHFTKQ